MRGGAPPASAAADLPLPDGGIHIDGSMLEGGEHGTQRACTWARAALLGMALRCAAAPTAAATACCRRADTAQCQRPCCHPGAPHQGGQNTCRQRQSWWVLRLAFSLRA